jgi:thymidylate synthase (FAD)
MEDQIGVEHPVLGNGYVRVVDYMGDDEAICEAARQSYGEGTRSVSKTRGLIRYLLRHRHTTPFEMCEIKLHVKLPIFVARQWIRHRTANVNEYSARYSILSEFFIPEAPDMMAQSVVNAQGRSDDAFPPDIAHGMIQTIRQHSEMSNQIYLELLTGQPWFDPNGTPWSQYHDPEIAGYDMQGVSFEDYEKHHGLARELARMVMPPNVMTEWYWKVDLHNLLHFLKLRADPHAQREIRVYAEMICQIVADWVPLTFEAWEDYSLHSHTFSRQEMEQLRQMVKGYQLTELVPEGSSLSEREHRAFGEALGLV